MAARFLRLSEAPDTCGGDFERQAARRLCESLPETYLVIAGACFATRGGSFYENDLIITSPCVCEVLELKHLYPSVTVYEDKLVAEGNFEVFQVFSLLERKVRVLLDVLARQPFCYPQVPRIESRVVVGDRAAIQGRVPSAFQNRSENRSRVRQRANRSTGTPTLSLSAI